MCSKNGTSIIWNSLIKVIHWVKRWISWEIGNGKNVYIGIDPFVGDKGNFDIPQEILEHLEFIGLKTLAQIKHPRWSLLKGGYWFDSKDIGLTGIWADLWDRYINTLNFGGIRLRSEDD